MTTIRFSDAEETRGIITMQGREIATVLPPDDSEAGAIYAAFLSAGGTVTPYSEPPAPVPEEVSRLQGRMALRAAGTPLGVQDSTLTGIFDRVEAKIAASGNVFLQEAWASASTWKRQSPFVQAMADAESLSEDQLDSLFRSAGLFLA